MAAESRRTSVRVDSDGVRVIETTGVRPSVWVVAVALVALACAVLFLRMTNQNGDREQIASNSPAANTAGAIDAPQRAQPPKFRPVPKAEPPDEPARVPGQAPGSSQTAAADEMDKPVSEDDAEDAPTGIALFPPPGTDPIKRGLIVPEDFELPPGYVRHYQVTDDGRRLPAILMFHPDYDWVDANGERIEVPADHIVPPELAPAGLPLQTLDVPEVIVPMIEEPGDGEAGD